MKHLISPSVVLRGILGAALVWVLSASVSAQSILQRWKFDDDGDLQGWTSNHLTSPEVSDGTLKAAFTDHDPFIVSPQFEFETKPGQVVEIRMRSKSDWRGELFFSGTNEGRYNGFTQDRSLDWPLVNDGKWHDYRVFPNWMNEGKIIKIRIDLGTPSESLDGRNGVEIDYIRIVDLDLASAVPTSPDWNVERIQNEWNVETDGDRNVYRSPIFSFDAEKSGRRLFFAWDSTSNATENAESNDLEDETAPALSPSTAIVRFLGDRSNGLQEIKVPVDPTARQCNVDLSQVSDWAGTIYQLEIALPDDDSRNAETTDVLKTVQIGDQPRGKAQWNVVAAGPIDSLNRAGSDVSYEVVLQNVGGRPIENGVVRVTENGFEPSNAANESSEPLRLTGCSVDGRPTRWESSQNQESRSESPWTIRLPSIAPFETIRLTVAVRFPTAGFRSLAFDFDVASDASEVANSPRLQQTFDVTNSLNLPKADYVPEPRPVESDYEIGALYFPGWAKREAWDKIQKCDPIRKPVLGWYDESKPEVVDWQIKWAVENGIQFFLVDWYWSRGSRSLEHWVQAFQQAKYRSRLKWAAMWANHNGAGSHSEEDQLAVTKYWIENYFQTPEYYRIDGKPVVMIWDPKQMDLDVIKIEAAKGNKLERGEGVRKLLDLSRKTAIEAGLEGIYFVAMKWPEDSTKSENIQWLKDGGFDATSIYHFMSSGGKAKNPIKFPFDLVVDASLPYWQARQEAGILPFWPNLSTGWDSRPWHGDKQTIIYDRTVEKFRKICEDAKAFADATGVKRLVLAPINEWGEGSYIEPNAEFGFGMYEAIRETFCKRPADGFPINFGPKDVGLGPYDLPPTDRVAD